MEISCFFERNAGVILNYSQIPCLSCGFSISRTPYLNFVPKTKHCGVTKLYKFRAINALVRNEAGSVILEKESGFKPSFDEQLKVMESVITKRKKRKESSTLKEVSSSILLDRDEKGITIRKFESRLTETRPSQVKQDRPIETFSDVKYDAKEMVKKKTTDTSKVALSIGSLDKANVENVNHYVQVASRNIESETSLKAHRNVGLNITNDRWVKTQTVSSKKLESFSRESVRPRFNREMSNFVENTRKSRKIGEAHLHDEKFSRSSFILENDEFKERELDREKWYSKSSDMHNIYDIDRTRGAKVSDQKFVLKNGNKNNSRNSRTKDDGDNLEMERTAFQTFDEFNDVMDQPRVSRLEMEKRIQKLANWLNSANINIPEWMFSDMMRSARIKFADFSIVRIIQILGKLGNWRRVLQVLEWIQMRERFKSHKLRYIYTAALDVLGSAKRPVEAFNVFHVMQQQMSSYPDLVAYHSIAVTLGQAGHLKELFDVIDSIRSPPKKKFSLGVFEKWDPRLEPDVVVFNAVLNACVQRKQFDGALWVLQQLKQQGQQPSCTTYGLIMEVMFACGKYDLVHEFFSELKKYYIPNALTYKVLLNTLWREGKTDEAVLAVKDMERRGIIGPASLYYDLARCLCSGGRCDEALIQLEKICKVANKPLVVTYTGLIQACLDSENIQNGTYIFHHMRKFCSPNLATYNIMLKGYVKHGMFQEAKQLFHIMLKATLPDVYTFNTMLEACFEDKRWDDFSLIYTQMLHRGYQFNAKRHLRMILDASRSGKGELLETTWKHLARADEIKPLPLTLEMFCMKLEKDDYSAAISCIIDIPSFNLPALSKKSWLKLLKENEERFQKTTLDLLVKEVSTMLSRSDLPDPIIENLVTSCIEFLNLYMNVDLEETVGSLPSRTALKV